VVAASRRGKIGGMNSWILLAWIFFVWLVSIFAALTDNAVEDLRRPLPNGQKRGYSPFPVIPIAPLALRGLAKLLDLAIAPWGSQIVAWLHTAWAVLIGVVVVLNVRTLRKGAQR
jgi:hypothetical protein